MTANPVSDTPLRDAADEGGGAGIGGHHSSKARTTEWLTPPWLLEAIGPFDLDPCAPIAQPYPTAGKVYTKIENGLIQRWEGRAFVNPPYSTGVVERWLARLAEHGTGTALIFARTETEAFFRYVWDRAAALLFIRGRINFHFGAPWTDPKTGRRYDVGDVAPGNAGAPVVLCAYGSGDADVLSCCGVEGRFVPLLVPRFVLGSALADGATARKLATSSPAPRQSRSSRSATPSRSRRCRPASPP